MADLRDCRTDEFRGFGTIPWWSWNGDMEYAEMRRQLRLMVEGGVDGWMLFPRFGLEMPYLGHEYLTKVRFAVEESARLGLEVWLYDEYAWPSGNAKCQVGEVDPEYRWRVLSTFTYDFEGGREVEVAPDWGRTGHIRQSGRLSGESPHADEIQTDVEVPLSYLQQSRDIEGNRLFLRPRIERVVAAPVRDGEAVVEEAINLDATIEAMTVRWTPRAGRWRVYILVSRDYGILVDHLNPEATRTFLELTHEKYKQYVGDHFGTTIKGFFSDETRMFRDTSHRFQEPTIVWTKEMFGRLEDRGLHEIDAAMAAVFEEGDSPAMRRLRLAFWERIADMYYEAFYRPLCAWAEENGMVYSGDCFSEDRSVIPYLGDYFKCMQDYHIPGCDSLGLVQWEAKEDYKSPKFPSSVAHLRGEGTRCIAEGPGLLGWGVTLENLRRTGDWLYAFGANRLVPNSFLYTLNHEQLYVSPSYFFHWTMWQHFRDWDGYVRRLGYTLTRGTHVAPVAVLYPTETLLSGFRPVIPAGGRPWSSGPETERCYHAAVNTAYGLLCRQIDFDYVPAEWLLEQDVSEGEIRVNGTPRVLILAGHYVLRRRVAARIIEFLENGGMVVWVGELRALDEDGHSQEAFFDWFESEEHGLWVEPTDDQEELEDRLVVALETRLALPLKLEGPRARQVAAHLREGEDAGTLFLASQSADPHEVTLQVRGWDGMERCDLLTGEWHPTPARDGRLALEFAPWESVLLRKAAPAEVPVWTEQPLEDQWELEVLDWNLHAPEPVTMTTRWQSRAGWEALLTYVARFEVEVTERLERCLLVLDDVDHLHRNRSLRLAVNDRDVAFRWSTVVDPLWVEAEVAPFLRPGRNTFQVEFDHTDYDSDKNLFTKRRSPAPQIRPRLMGKFLRRESTLAPLPKTLPDRAAGDLVPEGLAFYSGRVAYRQSFTLNEPATLAGVALEDLAHQAIVRIDGEEVGRFLWHPLRCYCRKDLGAGEHTLELEVTGTQANQMFEDPRPFGLMGEVRLLWG